MQPSQVWFGNQKSFISSALSPICFVNKSLYNKDSFVYGVLYGYFVLAASINSSWFSNIYLNYYKLRHSLFDILNGAELTVHLDGKYLKQIPFTSLLD